MRMSLRPLSASQMFVAFAYLHERGICHRDVKPENVMMVTDDADDPRYWDVKLTDFGLSCAKENVYDNVMKTLHGTPEFAAPEVETSAPQALEQAMSTLQAQHCPDTFSCCAGQVTCAGGAGAAQSIAVPNYSLCSGCAGELTCRVISVAGSAAENLERQVIEGEGVLLVQG